MQQLELYSGYSRDEAIARLVPEGTPTEYSDGELVIKDDIGILFAVTAQPPSNSYFLSNTTFRWFSVETTIQFYNVTMLSFPSIYRASARELYLFVKRQSDAHYTFVGSLRVTKGEGPSEHGSPEFPAQVIVQFEIEPSLPPEIWAKFDWSTEQIFINGLPLPQSLISVITQNHWMPPTESAPYREVFGKNHAGGWFLTPDQMERHTDQLHRLYRDGYSAGYALCETDDETDTKLVLSKSICLGDTGPDEPFCLDYRYSYKAPRVVYLVGDQPYWKVIASDIETFIRKLGL